jgi:hypothetical protein
MSSRSAPVLIDRSLRFELSVAGLAYDDMLGLFMLQCSDPFEFGVNSSKK